MGRWKAPLTPQHAALSPKIPLDTLEEFYEATRVACEEAKNEVGLLACALRHS